MSEAWTFRDECAVRLLPMVIQAVAPEVMTDDLMVTCVAKAYEFADIWQRGKAGAVVSGAERDGHGEATGPGAGSAAGSTSPASGPSLASPLGSPPSPVVRQPLVNFDAGEQQCPSRHRSRESGTNHRCALAAGHNGPHDGGMAVGPFWPEPAAARSSISDLPDEGARVVARSTLSDDACATQGFHDSEKYRASFGRGAVPRGHGPVITIPAAPSKVENLASAFAMEYLTGHYRPLRADEQARYDQLRVVLLAFAAAVRQADTTGGA